MSSFDLTMMQRALALAERGRGAVEPNPMVGAVVVKNQGIIGEGWHQKFGGSHAEIHALEHAGVAARDATLYVTLEPCCHQGKTPPCTQAIIQAGVKRVVAACRDPFPKVNGGGFAQLQKAGVEAVWGVGQERAEKLNRPYFKLVRKGKPWVIGKWAMTLDGRIATRTGDSKWISNELSRARVHELRGRMDGIVVGIGTVLADDPKLTARPAGPRKPARIILDRQLRLPLTSQLVRTARETPVLVVHQEGAEPACRQSLMDAGCSCLPIAATDPQMTVQEMLLELGRQRYTNILVEGGGKVLSSFFQAGEVDEVWTFISPKILGDGISPLVYPGSQLVQQATPLLDLVIEQLDTDVFIHGFVSSS